MGVNGSKQRDMEERNYGLQGRVGEALAVVDGGRGLGNWERVG